MDMPTLIAAVNTLSGEQKQEIINHAMVGLTMPELRLVNQGVLRLIGTGRAEIAATFKAGDIVEFDSRSGRMNIRVVIERINTKSCTCTELDAAGNRKTKLDHPGWRIGPSLLRRVAAGAPVASAAPMPTGVFNPSKPAAAPEPEPEETAFVPSGAGAIAGSW